MTPRSLPRSVLWLVAAAAGGASLSSCALGDRMRQIATAVDVQHARIHRKQSEFADAVADPETRRAAQDVPRPWLAGRAQPLARELVLPTALRADVNTTLLFADGGLDLTLLAQRITAATNIPVHVRPDALLPPETFLPRLNRSGAAPSMASTAPLLPPGGGPEPLARILDRIGARLGIMWRYHQDRIEFYRTETRSFNVRALTLDATSEASLGQGGGAASEGFVSTSRTQLASTAKDVFSVVRARIEPFLTQAGIVVAEPGAGSTVVVTDTPEALSRIAAYLDHENRALTRRVRLIVEEFTVVLHDSAEAGIDWNLVFSSARLAATLVAPGSGVVGGALGARLDQGPFAGSEAVIKALNEVGKVVRRSSMPVLTLNRRPVTHAVRTTFSYIDRVETTALGAAAGLALPSVSVSQREETVGSLLTLVPDAQEDGQILLSVAYDNTVAQPLKSVTFGDKENPLQLQQITIDGNGTVQQVALQPGQPVLISGFDRTVEETEGRRLNPGIPLALGGADRASAQHLTTIMMVSAQVEEGY